MFCLLVGLVTFRQNKYMAVRGFKLGSGARKKRKSDVLIQPRKYFQYFLEWGFRVFSINISHVHGPKNTTSAWN